jgi:regulator of sirC expression with transglutaminase-like and TPR domain
MTKEQISAMVTLLDDSDHEVVSLVSSNIKEFGKEVIPFLETEWEKNGLNPIIQKKIENLVRQLQLEDLKNELISWKSDENDDLLKGLWLVSKYQFPELKIEELKKEIKEIYLKVYIHSQPEMHPKDLVNLINQVVFEDFGFESNVKNFHSSANSMFNLVLDQKKGNPVALSCIYILIAEKLNVPIYGVNLPNLFVLIFDFPGYIFYINPFNKGKIFYSKDIDEYLKQMNLDLDQKFYKACSNVEIILRILNNLVYAYSKSGEDDKKAEVLELIEVLNRNNLSE